MLKTHITKEEINDLPIGKYEGKIEIIDQIPDVDGAVQEIRRHPLIGFDTETKPTFQKGLKNPVSLVQLATSEKVYLFRLNQMGLLPYPLVNLFANSKHKLIGLAIRDDIKDLQLLESFDASGFIELSEITRNLGIVNAGARGLAGLLLNIRISKSQQTSNWENDELTEPQIRYAATDAWVCLEIYRHLLDRGYIN